MYITVLYAHYIYIYIYTRTRARGTPVSTGITFQDLPRLRETADNTKHYI